MGSAIDAIGNAVSGAVSAIGDVVSEGTQLLGAASDLLKNGVSDIAHSVIDSLPIPQALKDGAEGAFDAGIGNFSGASQDLQNLVKDLCNNGGSGGTYNGGFDQPMNDLANAITQFLQQALQESNGQGGSSQGGGASGSGGSAGAGGTSGSSGGGDFFMAMAKALGQAAQQQANAIQQDSQNVTNDMNGGAKSGDPNLVQDQTTLMADSQKLGFMMQSINTCLNAVGDALKTAAQKQ